MRKWKKGLSVAMALGMALSMAPLPAQAKEGEPESDELSYDGYNLVFEDEFEGTELDRSAWNVELHEKGWVNSELQEYVDSEENIEVKDGKLYINPVKKETEVSVTNQIASDSPVNSIDVDVTEDQLAGNPWDVQKLQEGLKLESGKTYMMSFDASSSVPRMIQAGVQLRSGDYHSYGSIGAELTEEGKTFSFIFTMSEDDENGGMYFNLGKTQDETPASNIKITNCMLLEVKPVSLDASVLNGTYELDSASLGSNPWDKQQLSKVAVQAGHQYLITYKASSTVARSVVVGVQQTSDPWAQYGQDFPTFTEEVQEYSFIVEPEVTDENAGLYFNLGKDGETPESTVVISDVKMTDITAAGDSGATETTYTSGRISTQNKETFTYGLFEVTAKVPEGQGYLPAFWLMANDENVYGQWPRCGEIDCMEIKGQDTQTAYGTIHFGNPRSESQGTYVLSGEDSFSSEYHTFQTEWLPGKIRWYVDGVLYYEEDDWYSATEGQGTLTYPAPFDQPFYMILNLAVGGSWVGNPDESTSFEDNSYVIESVRVYQKDAYDEDVTKPEKVVDLRDPDADGNYIVNGTFAVAEDLTDDTDWKFLLALGGEGAATIEDNTMKIETENQGTVDYSVQLVQANIPLEKGATYQVSFDAKASEARTMNVDVKAPDHGYKSYMSTQKPELTTEYRTFTYEFVMKDDSDANGRLEYNMGKMGSTGDIEIKNVVVKKIADPDPNAKEEKVVLANGNFIYNGKFQEGDGHLGYWDVDGKASVTDYADGRRLAVTADQSNKTVISQEDLTFNSSNPLAFSFDAKAEKASTVVAMIGGSRFEIPVEASSEAKTYSVTIAAGKNFTDASVSMEFEGNMSIDNVSLVEDAMIKNGSFADGLTGYEVYVDSSADASYVVDSLQEDSALDVTVNNTSDQDWKIQVKQNNVKLEKGKTYKLTFDAKATMDREIRVIMQGTEARGWSVYSNDNIVKLTDEYKTFTDTFTMAEDTDAAAFLSICLGKVGDEVITDQHRVLVDNISLVEIGESGSGADLEDVVVGYAAHVQNYGWLDTKGENGTVAGTVGKSKRLEAITMNVIGNGNLGIRYATNSDSYGWTGWCTGNEVSGTTGESKAIEAVKIELTGEDADLYDVYYRLHVANYGWLGWAKNGEAAGTIGLSKRAEAIQTVIVPKGTVVPDTYEGVTPNQKAACIPAGSIADVPGADVTHVAYKSHLQTTGWQKWVADGESVRTEAKRLEAVTMKLSNKEYEGSIIYNAHVQGIGWQNSVTDRSTWTAEGEVAGTEGQSKRMEAIQIALTGEIAEHYDVEYRVYDAQAGWTNWVKNGACAGTTGLRGTLESIEVRLVEK